VSLLFHGALAQLDPRPFLFSLDSAVIAVHNSALALGQNTPFNALYELQQFASSLAFNQIRPPRLWWSESFDEVSVDGATLNLAKFRAGIDLLIKTTWEMYDGLTGGKRFVDRIPENFVDRLPNDTHGYSFLSHGPFTSNPHGLLQHLVKDLDLAFVDGYGRLSWNIPALRRFFDTSDQMNTLHSVLAFILTSPSNRVTQFTDYKFKNDLRPRNLHMLQQEMFLLSRYNKMTNLTGYDECIPCFYPKRLQDLTLELLAGGLRECEVLFSSILYGPEAAGRYDR
jgi:hypothetical protein